MQRYIIYHIHGNVDLFSYIGKDVVVFLWRRVNLIFTKVSHSLPYPEFDKYILGYENSFIGYNVIEQILFMQQLVLFRNLQMYITKGSSYVCTLTADVGCTLTVSMVQLMLGVL